MSGTIKCRDKYAVHESTGEVAYWHECGRESGHGAEHQCDSCRFAWHDWRDTGRFIESKEQGGSFKGVKREGNLR